MKKKPQRPSLDGNSQDRSQSGSRSRLGLTRRCDRGFQIPHAGSFGTGTLLYAVAGHAATALRLTRNNVREALRPR
jgi:hypothetical protein